MKGSGVLTVFLTEVKDSLHIFQRILNVALRTPNDVAERINVFHIDDEYLFNPVFDRTDLFDEFQEDYNDEEYRFDIPVKAIDDVRERLSEEYFEPVVIQDPGPYCVVKDKYTKHADILRNSVVHWERRSHLFFIVKDELAVKEALEQGADRLEETDFVLGI